MQITFDPYNPVERAFVASVVNQIEDSNSDGAGFASVEPTVAASEGEASTKPSDATNEAASEPAAEPKRRRRTKAEMEAARAAEAAAPQAEPAPQPDPFAAQPQPEPAPAPEAEAAQKAPRTQEDVRAALSRYTQINGMNAGIALLNSFNGAKRISDLDPSIYDTFVAKCGH